MSREPCWCAKGEKCMTEHFAGKHEQVGHVSMPLVLDLPYPPSVNHYWRSNRGRVHISAEGKAYRDAMAYACLSRPLLEGRLRVEVLASPPDRRRRDLDNIAKALLDALTHCGVYVDDSQIDDLRIVRRPPYRGGHVRVTISCLG